MPFAEYACVFVRSSRERLAVAERLVRALPSFLEAEGECDLHHCGASGYLAAVVRAAAAAFTPDVRARLAFWSARLGARGFLVGELDPREAGRFSDELALCERAVRGTPLAGLPEASSRFFRALGAPGRPAASPHPPLAVDLDGPGGEGVAYAPERRALFVAGVLAPPRGDQLTVAVRAREAPAPVEGWATVVEVRARLEAAPGRPAGFTLRIEGPSALHELLARRARASTARDVRAAPRISVNAPVKVTPVGARPALPPRAPARPTPRARLEYATDQELAADWIENLSQGGAFVRSAAPLPEGTELVLELGLPDGGRLEAAGVVVYASAAGMGVRFVLAPDQDAILSAVMTRISARPRRALVVDDDALVRRMLSDALAARGFEVVAAGDGAAGLQRLAEEILTLDVLVTDACMPGMDGEAFIRTIRQAGGEAELAIVAVSGALTPERERALEAAGADAVLDKALGPEFVSQAVDAALERKRLVRQADAA